MPPPRSPTWPSPPSPPSSPLASSPCSPPWPPQPSPPAASSPPELVQAVKSAALEAARSSTRGSGWDPSGLASSWECRAAQRRQRRPEGAQESLGHCQGDTLTVLRNGRGSPYVVEATPLCGGGYNPVWRRLQPCVAEAATLCGRGCSPLWPCCSSSSRISSSATRLAWSSADWSSFRALSRRSLTAASTAARRAARRSCTHSWSVVVPSLGWGGASVGGG